MTNGYILEIRTSSSSPGADEFGGGGAGNGPKKNMNRTDRLKAQFKGIDSKDNDLALRMNSRTVANGKGKRRHQGVSEKHGRKSSSHSLDKYIKFTVKRSDRSEDDILNRLTKFMFIFFSVGLFWHVLNNVDPIGKVIGGRERLREMNDVFWREYRKLTSVLNGRRYRIDERFLKKSEHAGGELGYNMGSESRTREGFREAVVKVFLVVEKVFYEMKLGRDECFVQDLISMFYLGISVFVINEIYWRIYHEIEESLIIIPHLGVQAESILIKENIWQVLKSVLGLRRLLFNMNPGLTNAPTAATASAPVPSCSKEKGVVINKQFVPMDYVKDIVINEGFKGFEVVFYMTLIMEEGVVVMSGGSEERWDAGEDAGHARRSSHSRPAPRRADRDGRTGLDVVVDVDRRLAEDDDNDDDDDDDGYDGGRSGEDGAETDTHDTGYYSGDQGGHRTHTQTQTHTNPHTDAEQTKLKMIVVFPNLLPRRAVLETVFRKSREYLKR